MIKFLMNPARLILRAAEAEGAGAAPAKVEREKAPTANGVPQPAAGTKTRRVWDIATEISNQNQRPALRDEVMRQGEAEGLSKGTIATQYGKWCTYYGVTTEQRKAVRAESKAGSPEPVAEQAEPEAPAAETGEE